MISIEKAPAKILLAGNPVRYDVTSDDFVTTEPEYASLNIHVSSVDQTDGHKFSIAFGDVLLEFTIAATAAPGDPLAIRAGTGSDTFQSWADSIYESFLANYILRQYFDLAFDYQTYYRGIILTAKQTGSAYSLTFNALTSTGLSAGTNNAGVDAVYRDNFGVLMDLCDENQGLIGEDFKSVDEDGSVTFNIAEYLLSELLNRDFVKFKFPETGADLVIERAAFVLPFITSYAEKYSGSVRKMVFDETRYAIAGGLSRQSLVIYNNKNTDYFSFPANKKRFLTWAPVNKKTTRQALEKLYFVLVDHGDENFSLEGEVFYSDGTSLPLNSSEMITFTKSPTVIECMVGYQQLGVGLLDPLRTVSFWKIWINNYNGLESEVRRFDLDNQYYEHTREMIFKNSFGVFDTILLKGILEQNLEHERIDASLTLDIPETFYNSPRKQYSALEQQTFKVNTGWLKETEKDWLRDLLVSDEIYEISGDQLIPVVITSNKTFMMKDRDNLYSLDFEYQRAFRDEYYSSQKAGTRITWDSTKITFDSTKVTFDQTIN